MERINEIAKFVSPYKIISDVGCDHGYTIKCAFDNYGITKAYAIDNKVGPLNQAILNLKDYNEVIFSLSDGLDDLQLDTEVLIISGLGGDLIRNILESNFYKLNNVKRIVIEANSKDKVVRQFLLTNGYTLEAEEIIDDDGYYIIDVFTKGDHDFSELEIKYGPFFLREKNEMFIDYWNQKIDSLLAQDNEYTIQKANKIKKELNL